MRWGVGLAGPAALLFVAACGSLHEPEPVAGDEPLGPYDYPLADPMAAMVVGTPGRYKAALPKRIPVEHLKLDVFEDHAVPEVFWYFDKLKFSVVRQDHPAPLVFNIAGAGGGYNAKAMQVMQRAFYKAGFHVISLSSPTHPNFIVAASSSGVPGRVREDARDLYRVMGLAYEKVRERIEVSEFYLTGYSLGGWLGFIDAAGGSGIPRTEEDFGQTLGYWGVGDGPYLVLPGLGPSNLRDAAGYATDTLAFVLADPFKLSSLQSHHPPIPAANIVNQRDVQPFRYYETGSPSEYELLRFLYTEKRRADIDKE